MDIAIHSREITEIRGYPSDEHDKTMGLPMERVRIITGRGECTVWLTAEQADQFRAALDEAHPTERPPTLDPSAEEVLIRYADEHGHEHNKVPAVNA